ncbi:b-cell receptor-associated protein [Sparganum proliferum]
MQLIWTLAAGFLYCEVLAVTFLLLPFVSVQRWNVIFNSRVSRIIYSNGSFYFNTRLALLIALLIESIRKMWLNSTALSELKRHPEGFNTETETIFLKRLFKSQRNLYICALALFLCFVIHRLTKLIADQARMLADQQTSSEMPNFGSPTSVSSTSEGRKVSKEQSLTRSDNSEDEIAILTEQIAAAQEEKKLAGAELKKARMQAAQLAREYAEVAAKFEALKVKLLALSDASVGPLVLESIVRGSSSSRTNDRIQSDEIMVSFDVTSLLTSIPPNLAREVLRRRLEEAYDETQNALKIEQLMRLFEFCQQTFFTFAGEIYEQTKGTPMGSPISGLEADLVLQGLEKIAFIQHEPVFWSRYVDDTFVIVKKDMLQHFHNLLNAVFPDIKFTREEEKEH